MANSRPDRETLFGNQNLLNKLTRAALQRKKATLQDVYRKRFSICDEKLCEILSKWESLYGEFFPVFFVWLNAQRLRGLSIQSVSGAQTERSVNDFKLLEVKTELLAKISATERELCELILAFTPSIEEVFDDLNEMIPSSAPREQEGVNEVLFESAREKFNFLVRKLIPRLSEFGDTERIKQITNSNMYRNFVLLLSQKTKNDDFIDTEYDDWF